jgi:DNA-binding transcriptional regulator YiaG
LTSSEIRTIIKLQSSEIKTELSFNSFVNVSGKYIVSDFRTKINRKFGNEVIIFMYERYVELRNQKGVSDYRVAKDTGIPKSTFSDWKSGRSKPKIAKLKILAGYFDVAVDELISATDETGSEEGRE